MLKQFEMEGNNKWMFYGKNKDQCVDWSGFDIRVVFQVFYLHCLSGVLSL